MSVDESVITCSCAVVERLLKKAAAKPVRMLGQTLTLERCSISESCSVIPGRCIVVSGVTRDTDVEEELVPLLENKRKSGGPVDKAERLSEDCVLITFVDQSSMTFVFYTAHIIYLY